MQLRVLDLPSFNQPADQRSSGDSYCERNGDGCSQVPLKALFGVVYELFGGIATAFCGMS
jgi:hypothetical protein